MPGVEIAELAADGELLQDRGWLVPAEPPTACGSASSRSRATSRPIARMLRELGAEAREVRTPADLDGLDGAGDPRRREHDDRDGRSSATASSAAIRAHSAARAADPRHLRRDDRLRPRAPRADRRRRAGATPSAASCRASRPTCEVEGIGDEPLRAVFIRAPWVERARPRGRGAGRGTTATRSRSARATCSPAPSTRS